VPGLVIVFHIHNRHWNASGLSQIVGVIGLVVEPYFGHRAVAGTLIDDIKKAKDSTLQRQRVKELFAEHDEGSGTLTYGHAFAILQPFMTRQGNYLNELGLIIQIASDNDGAVTEAEFLEFVESLLIAGKAAAPNKKAEPKQNITDEKAGVTRVSWNSALLKRLKNFRVTVVKRVKREVRELVDSVSMISQDFSYSAALLRSPQSPQSAERRFSKIESAWLWRTVKDVVLFLPIAAIIIAPLTPVRSIALPCTSRSSQQFFHVLSCSLTILKFTISDSHSKTDVACACLIMFVHFTSSYTVHMLIIGRVILCYVLLLCYPTRSAPPL